MTTLVSSDDRDELRPHEAAALLGVPSREIYRLIDQHELAAYRRDQRIVIPRSAVEQLKAQRSPR